MEKSQNNKKLRSEFKALRDGLSLSERKDKSHGICNNILALLESDFKGANIFLCFYPFGSEVDLLELYGSLLEEGKNLFFPVSNKNTHELTFYKINNLKDDFRSGAYGIMEPDTGLEKFDLDDSSTVVITPGLIFDENCNRIGYGAGYYDRFFSLHPDVIKVGVGYDLQIIDNLDVEAYDVPLDYVVTNNRLIKRGMQ
ncbi:5-formyltetrahydrofolate cyclo-ligase [Pseudobutyrivibrio sp.]|uniref:5-formyltetrahydrofolate cyclo-ligase n=1 Tax=Pseudobutyrivibrio sp. TaxID=2014367 RepID=UPI0025E7E9BF|nr:5-formyltetrahydrofolate cyclo-ligase [Pseudobutyrivibrio sp.]MBR5650584.1 5-formyltetrahydrofolate cyclo-ligase [Pseudobutyrivibrio sp.]